MDDGVYWTLNCHETAISLAIFGKFAMVKTDQGEVQQVMLTGFKTTRYDDDCYPRYLCRFSDGSEEWYPTRQIQPLTPVYGQLINGFSSPFAQL